MERRNGKLIVSKAGGTASKGSKTYKLSVPSSWIDKMMPDKSKRDIELMFDGTTIYMQSLKTPEEFAAQKVKIGHDVRKIKFYDKDKLCTLIYADFTDKTLAAENYSDNVVKTAFGNNSVPIWTDFEQFLSERCIPKERAGIREYLETIGVDKYNPFEIIKKTGGKMAEDSQWIEVEVMQ